MWTPGADVAFGTLGYNPEGPVYFDYEVNVDLGQCPLSDCFTASAYGDVDGNVFALFVIAIAIVFLGAIVGLYMGVFPYVEAFLYKFLVAFDKIPALTLLPILFMVLFGAIEFGLITYNKQVISNASREGARMAIAENANTGDVETFVRDYCDNSLVNLKGNTVLGHEAVGFADDGSHVTVTVSYQYDLLFASLLRVDAGAVTLTGATAMRKE